MTRPDWTQRLNDRDVLLQICGSPATIHFESATPTLSKTTLEGEGLRSGVAGSPSRLSLGFFDTYDNPAIPGSRFRFGVALMQGRTDKEGRTFKDVESQPFTMHCIDPQACQFEIVYTPKVLSARAVDSIIVF